MRWGRKWGKSEKVPGDFRANVETKWGGELDEYPVGRLEVRVVRGRIVPCDSCRHMPKCAMYFSFTRNRLRHGEHSKVTNILHLCDVYRPDKSPVSRKRPPMRGRTSGQTPT